LANNRKRFGAEGSGKGRGSRRRKLAARKRIGREAEADLPQPVETNRESGGVETGERENSRGDPGGLK
jgi:hypothetical protein